MGQADVLKFRTLRVHSADVAAAPVNGPPPPGTGTDALFQMSPIAPSGMPTTGFCFALQAPTATPAAAAAGFAVTAWFRDPNTYRWASSLTATVSYGQAWVCNDLDAIDGVYFQIAGVTGAGDIDVQFAEQ